MWNILIYIPGQCHPNMRQPRKCQSIHFDEFQGTEIKVKNNNETVYTALLLKLLAGCDFFFLSIICTTRNYSIFSTSIFVFIVFVIHVKIIEQISLGKLLFFFFDFSRSDRNFHKITSFFHSKYLSLFLSFLWMIINYFTLATSSFFIYSQFKMKLYRDCEVKVERVDRSSSSSNAREIIRFINTLI